jgi:hypothetical protein
LLILFTRIAKIVHIFDKIVNAKGVAKPFLPGYSIVLDVQAKGNAQQKGKQGNEYELL